MRVYYKGSIVIPHIMLRRIGVEFHFISDKKVGAEEHPYSAHVHMNQPEDLEGERQTKTD